ncbi:hypothetical protein Tco_1311482 [Tanacetum coccineum]
MNHYISSKSTSWDQIPTNIATAVICLTTNQKYKFSKLIFDGMMRHLDATKKFVMYPRFLQIFLGKQLKNVPVPMDHFPVPTLTKKVLTFMVKKGKNFLGKVTHLFDFMLVQPTEVEGAILERPSDSQPTSSPTHLYEAPLETKPDPSLRPSSHIPNPDSNPEASGGNNGGQSSSDKSPSRTEDGLTLQSVYDLLVFLCKQFTSQAKEIKALKAQVKKLKKKANPVISHHKAWLRATRLTKRRGVSKQGRKAIKSSKGDPTVHKDPAFNAFDDVDVDEAMDYMDAHYEERASAEKLSTDKPEVSTVQLDVSTDKQYEGTHKKDVSTDKQCYNKKH